MRKIDTNLIQRAKLLRVQGYSHREIALQLHLGLGTIFHYTKGIVLSTQQKQALKKKNYLNSLGKRPILKKIQSSRKGGINRVKQLVKLYTREKITELLRSFYKEHGRIPYKSEFSHEKVARKEFGSWNKAIEESGLKPNPVKFSKKYIAADGHICDSLAEKIIDDWLSVKKIPHERNVRYLDTRLTCDFRVKNVHIEFFGLYKSSRKYDNSMKKKLGLIKNNNLRLIALYQHDLFPISRLDILLKDL